MNINFTKSAIKFIDEALEKNKESLEDIALAIYTRRSIGWGGVKISTAISLIRAEMEEIQKEFQEIDKYKNGSSAELPILIDEKSRQLLSYHDTITVDAFGWGYFRKLGIRNSPVYYGSGSC